MKKNIRRSIVITGSNKTFGNLESIAINVAMPQSPIQRRFLVVRYLNMQMKIVTSHKAVVVPYPKLFEKVDANRTMEPNIYCEYWVRLSFL
jgi:hypothetical protein